MRGRGLSATRPHPPRGVRQRGDVPEAQASRASLGKGGAPLPARIAISLAEATTATAETPSVRVQMTG